MSIREKENLQQMEPKASLDQSQSKPSSKKKKPVYFLFSFGITFITWLVLSGRFDGFHIILGIISSLIVSSLSADLILSDPNIKRLPVVWFRFLRYIPWLLYQVLVANVHVLYLAFHPKMMELIDPQIVNFKSKLKSDISLLTLANSITLTPGTITVHISVFGDVTFHMIDVESGQSAPRIMDLRISEIFGD